MIIIVHVEATPIFSVISNAVASWVLLGWIMASRGGPWVGGENEHLQTARKGQEASDVVFSSEAVRS